jgi:hypothetical protein
MRAVLIAALIIALTAPPAAARLRLVRVGHFSQPVYIAGRPGALVVVERYGRVRVVRHGKVRTLLDLRHRVGIADPDVTVDQRQEVVALGLRNSWRFSFDRGRVLIGDVGEDSYEEVDVLPRDVTPGVNFGWPAYEGFHLRAGQQPFGIRMPALVHRHGPGWCSVVGGYVARAGAPRVLHGRYVYGDLCSGRLWSARQRGTALVDDRRLRVPPVFSPVSFGEDARGRLYLVSLGGDVFRLADSGRG